MLRQQHPSKDSASVVIRLQMNLATKSTLKSRRNSCNATFKKLFLGKGSLRSLVGCSNSNSGLQMKTCMRLGVQVY